MKRFTIVAQKKGLDCIRIPSMVWIVAAILIASSSAPACLDPPDDPPLLTEAYLDTLTFLKDVDDGSNGLAELRMLFTVDWGPGQCTTTCLWCMDHNFDTIPPPFSPITPPGIVIGSHTECTPAAEHTIFTQAWESDQGIDPLLELIAAAGGYVVGGTAGKLIARLVVGILSFFNADDPLTFDVHYTTTFSYNQFFLADGPCSAIAADYSATMGAAYRAAAEYSSDHEIADTYREYATYGVDDDHPFSRNASYASQRFAHLYRAIELADALTIEAGESGDVEPAKQVVRETAVDMAQIVADATIGEATTMGLDSTLLSEAQSLISSAEMHASAGNYRSAVSFYEDATVLLLPEMFPEFIIYPNDASNPSPYDYRRNVAPDATLTWTVGENVTHQDVYFGTDRDAVANANPGSPEHKVRLAYYDDSYSPGGLEVCRTYFWRVDRVIEEIDEPPDEWPDVPDPNKPPDDEPDPNKPKPPPWPPVPLPDPDEPDPNEPPDEPVPLPPPVPLPLPDPNEPPIIELLSPITTGNVRIYDDIYKGNVWCFTTITYLVVDDFEDYNDYPPDRIFETWNDGWGYSVPPDLYHIGNLTGSRVDIDPAPVYRGTQSMKFDYDNTGTFKNIFGLPVNACYSEAERTFYVSQDWIGEGFEALSLCFYGDPNNDPEPMYVALADSTGTLAVVYHDNLDTARIDTWAEWKFDLKDFADQGVNLANVDRIAIGFGTKGNMTTPGGSGKMYFDDIRLYWPRDIASEGTPFAADLNSDSVVDMANLGVMAEEWLTLRQ